MKMMANSTSGIEVDRPGHRRPADHRRKRPRRAADDDVLRRAPLQPHRIDEHIKANGQRQNRAAGILTARPITSTEPTARVIPNPRAGPVDPAGWDRPVAGSPHDRVDVAVVPHVDCAACPGRYCDAQDGGERQHRVRCPGATSRPMSPGEHHQGQDPRLQQRDPVSVIASKVMVA